MLAEIHLRDGERAESAATLDMAMEVVERQRAVDPSPRINEQLAAIHRVRGDQLRARGDVDLARREWRTALTLLAENPGGSVGADHHLIAGEARRRLGRADEAREHAEYLADRGWLWPEWVRRFPREATGAAP